MSVIERTAFEIQARHIIRQCRKVSRRAAQARGERICLACRLHIHHRRIPVLLAIAAGLVLDAWIVVHAL